MWILCGQQFHTQLFVANPDIIRSVGYTVYITSGNIWPYLGYWIYFVSTCGKNAVKRIP